MFIGSMAIVPILHTHTNVHYLWFDCRFLGLVVRDAHYRRIFQPLMQNVLLGMDMYCPASKNSYKNRTRDLARQITFFYLVLIVSLVCRNIVENE